MHAGRCWKDGGETRTEKFYRKILTARKNVTNLTDDT